MNEQFVKQAEEMMQAAQQVANDVRVPENLQAIAEDGVARSREVYDRMSIVAKDTGKAVEEIAGVAQKGARTLSEHIFENLLANTEAVFDAAEAVARCKTFPEAAKIQADFMQQQMAKAGEQTKEFYELSTKVAMETMDHVGTVATKTIDQVKTHG